MKNLYGNQQETTHVEDNVLHIYLRAYAYVYSYEKQCILHSMLTAAYKYKTV